MINRNEYAIHRIIDLITNCPSWDPSGESMTEPRTLMP